MRAHRIVPGLALALALVAGAACAQEAPERNPLAPPAGWWQGTFANQELRLTLREEGGRVAGELTVGEETWRVTGRIDDEGQLACAFVREGGPSHGLVIGAEEGGRTLVLQSGGATHRLDRIAGAPAGDPLAHVRAGQRWVYDMSASGMRMRQIYEIQEVGDGRVKCLLHMLLQMPGDTEFSQQGEPTPFEWALPGGAGAVAGAPQPEVKTRRERVTIAGREWDCLVSEVQGTSCWIPMQGDRPIFPPYVKMAGPTAQAELVQVLEPPAKKQ